MAEGNRTIIGIFAALVVIIAGVVGWWLLTRDNVDATEEAVVAVVPTPVPAPTPSLEERLSEKLSGRSWRPGWSTRT
jgi:hypothetical protein